MTTPRKLTVYSREGCHLCQIMIAELKQLCSGAAVTIEVVDIDSDAVLAEKYGRLVPVLVAEDGETLCRYHLDEAILLDYLAGEK